MICEGKHEHFGSLPTLIKRIGPSPELLEIDVELWRNPRGGRRRFRKTGKGDGVFKKLISSLFDAEELDYDAVICLIDQDRCPERNQSVDKAQMTKVSDIPRAFGVAIEKFDAWFLADEKALSTVCGKTVSKQPSPEQMRDPKQHVRKICDDAGFDSGLAEFYVALAEVISFVTLRERCPTGFGVWADRVSQLEFSR